MPLLNMKIEETQKMPLIDSKDTIWKVVSYVWTGMLDLTRKVDQDRQMLDLVLEDLLPENIPEVHQDDILELLQEDQLNQDLLILLVLFHPKMMEPREKVQKGDPRVQDHLERDQEVQDLMEIEVLMTMTKDQRRTRIPFEDFRYSI